MLDRKTPPPFVHTTSFELISPVTKKLSNGIDLLLVNGGDQDVIKIECIFKAGRWHESQIGVAHFSAQLLNKGTASRSSFQIASIFDRYGAHLEIQPGFDYVSVSVYALTKYLSPVIDLVIELLTEPAFPEKELQQSKAIFLQNLKINEEKTSYLASKAFRKLLFGEDHPYGKELEEPTTNAIERQHLEQHYQRHFHNPLVIISGKISPEAEESVSRKFNALRTGKSPAASTHTSQTNIFHERIKKEGSVQSSMRVGKKSLRRNHPDYAKAIFAMHILGGYFGSRLMRNIREEKGLTYGIYASIHPLQQESYFSIGADVNSENVNLALDEIRKELKILRTEKISDEELDTARNHFIGSMQSEITTPFAHADKIKTIVLSGLPDNFYQEMIHIIDGITAENIIEVTERYFHEDSLNDVCVG